MSSVFASTATRGRPLRLPAVAGRFYPDRAETLRQLLAELFEEAGRLSASPLPPPCPSQLGSPQFGPLQLGPLLLRPKVLIVPHAGYAYSGLTAAFAYRRLMPHASSLRRVVLLGPCHRVPVAGLALPEAGAFLTPLGAVPVDEDLYALALAAPGLAVSAAAHAEEHSLEVQLPFLQSLLGEFSLLPLLVGDADAQAVAAVLGALWGGPETLLVVSTDLSHYHAYATARERDAATCAAILARRPTLGGEQACGCRPLNGLLSLAAQAGHELELLDYRTSGDTAGDRERVVGYAAFALYEARA